MTESENNLLARAGTGPSHIEGRVGTRGGWLVVMLAGVLVLGGLGWQWLAGIDFRVQVSVARAAEAERLRVVRENTRLQEAMPSAAELELLRSDHDALEDLRQELRAVQTAVKQRKPTPPSGGPIPRTEALALPAEEWRNAGGGTPRAAFETALWAAAGGDVELLRKMLYFDPAAASAAKALFARLPKSARAQYGNPESLIAWLTAADITFGSMWVREENSRSDAAKLRVLLQWTHRSRMPVFTLQRSADGWRLAVPARAIQAYAVALRLPAG